MTAPTPAALDALIARLRGVLPVCPYDRRSPDYWTTDDDAPCKICGTTNDPNSPDLCRGANTSCMPEAADALTALQARALASDTARASAETALAEAREALRPFARHGDYIAEHFEDHDDDVVAAGLGESPITMGDFRRARAALEAAAAVTPAPDAAVEAGAKAMTTDQMRSVLHAAGLEFSPAQDTLIRYWARLAVEAAAPLIAPPDGAVEAAAVDGAAYWKGAAERALSKQIDMAREHAESLAEVMAALEWIRDAHIPDQPAATNGSEFDWAVRWVRTIRLHAKTALEQRSAAPKPGSGV